MNRYDGKPFLRLIECYVLSAIDQLDDVQAAALTKMESRLGEVYKINGSWLDIVIAQMDFSESLPEKIRKSWFQYLEQAKEKGMPVDPNEFVRSLVDKNFSEVIS